MCSYDYATMTVCFLLMDISFLVLAIMNSGVISILVRVFWWARAWICSCELLLGQRVRPYPALADTTKLFSKATASVYTPTGILVHYLNHVVNTWFSIF